MAEDQTGAGGGNFPIGTFIQVKKVKGQLSSYFLLCLQDNICEENLPNRDQEGNTNLEGFQLGIDRLIGAADIHFF